MLHTCHPGVESHHRACWHTPGVCCVPPATFLVPSSTSNICTAISIFQMEKLRLKLILGITEAAQVT